MSASSGDDLVSRIRALGWAQGHLIPDPGHAHAHAFPDKMRKHGEASPSHWTFTESADKALLVLASQTCDIVKTSLREPFVDAMRAAVVSALPPRNSYRFFPLDDGRLLVADAAFRVQVAKEALTIVSPQPGLVGDSLRRAWFSVWLANRYTREAFPDEVVVAVVGPIRDALRKLAKSLDPDIRRALAAFEVRIVDLVPAPTYRVNLLMLTDQEVGPELRMGAARIIDALAKSIRPTVGTLESCPILNHDEISLREFLSTKEIDLDDLSFAGGLF